MILHCLEILVLTLVMPRRYQFDFPSCAISSFLRWPGGCTFAAAEALALAQPALSRQIAQFEKALGTALFVRTSRRVELTPAGEMLASQVEPLLHGLAGMPARVRGVAEGKTGHIRVGFTGLAMATVLPPILRDFHRRHPAIHLELNESPTSAQLLALAEDEITCGFFHPDGPTPGLQTRLLQRERNGILLPADHPLAVRAFLQLRDLAATPFILFPRTYNPGFYDRILAAFSKAAVAPRIAEEVWPRANGVGLVRAGMGATFMCPSEARTLPPEVAFRPLRGPAPESRLVVGWRNGVEKSNPALKAFLDVALAANP